MSSGGYDGLHPSSSYAQGDSWRPSGSSVSAYDRPNYHHPRRRSPSPSRHYAPYDNYYPPANNYRPNSYRPDEDEAYYSRSPSPDQHSRAYPRAPEPDAWERPDPWADVPALPGWEETMGPASPTSSTSKARRDAVLAARMFEPSDAWKHHHVDRPPRMDTTRPLSTDMYISEPLAPRTPNPYSAPNAFGTPNTYSTSNTYPTGDRYRPTQPHRGFVQRLDSYRPGRSPPRTNTTGKTARRWSPSPNNSPEENFGRGSRRSSSRYSAQGRRVSGTGSMIGSGSPRRSSSYRKGRRQDTRSRSRSRRSSSRGRRSYSRSSSRRSRSRGHRSSSRGRRSLSRSRRSISRGRRSLSRGRRSTTLRKSSSPEKRGGKYSWDRPTSSKAGATKTPAQPLQKSSWTRSASRSSIASTHASDRAPSPPPQVQSAQPKEPSTSPPITSEDIKPDSKQEVAATNVETAPALEAAMSKVNDAPMEGVLKDAGVQELPALRTPSCDDVLAEALSASAFEARAAAPLPSPPLSKVSVHSQAPVEVNGIAKAAVLDSGSRTDSSKYGNGVQVPQKATTQLRLSNASALTNSPPVPPTAQRLLASLDNPADAPHIHPVAKEHHDLPSEVVLETRSSEIIAASLPTPLPTPQPQSLPESPPASLPDSIPAEAKSIREALRIVVMTRLLCDPQTREERVNPVLLSNLSIAAQSHEDRPSATPEEVIKEIVEGPRHRKIMENFDLTKPSLVERFKERQNLLTEKVQRLKEEYLTLHERWVSHCAALDEQSKPAVPETTETVQPAGRTTRRSMANLGDAVRSDLEMEQIIASLGIDDATDPNHLSLRNLATVPDMISVTNGRVDYVYDDTNHLVHNPSEYYGPHTGIHDWTEQEKEVFLDQFAAQPKQFGIIADHLPNKTPAQCVDYYYLHKKKFIDFRKVISMYAPNKRKRRGTGKKKGNGLLADIRQHDAEVHGQLGSSKTSGRPTRGRKAMAPPEPRKLTASRRRTQLDLTPSAGSATPTPEPESRLRGRRSIAAPLSRTVSVSQDDAEEEVTEEAERPAKRAKRTRKVKSAAIVTEEPSTPEPKLPDQTESISRRKSGSSSIQWSDEDKSLFLTLLGQHGDDFKRIAASMPNKTTIQVSNYYKVNLDELDLEKVAAGAPKHSPTPDPQEERKEALLPGSDVTTPDPMASLAPDPPQTSTNETPPAVHQEAPRHESDSKPVQTWPSPALRSYNDPIAESNVRGYPYHPAPYSSHPVPPTYAPPAPVPYTYPPYSGPHYPQYDPSINPHPFSRMPQSYSMPPDPTRRISTTVPTRENPYPVLPPPGHPSYPSSLESQ